MKVLTLLLLAGSLASLAKVSPAQDQQPEPEIKMGRRFGTPPPTDLSELDETRRHMNGAGETAARRVRRIDIAEARKNAQELAALAGKIPEEVGQLSKNVYPRNLNEELKQIEKLSKRLRAEINR